METPEVAPTAKGWSVLNGPAYDPKLHLPSAAMMEFVLQPNLHSRPEAALRVAAGGTLISILELLHPDLQGQSDERQRQLKELQQEAGKSIMYSWKLDQTQKQEIFAAYKNLGIMPPAAAEALNQLREEGLDTEIAELAEWGLMVLAIKEADPELKLPVPSRDILR
jgi:hypothetical protein